jgi:Peptidase M66
LLFPSGDSALVLVAGKAVLVKVNATTTKPNEAKPAGSLRVETTGGQLVQTLALTAPTDPLPAAAPVVPSFANSYTAVVPANLVKAGLRLTASLANNGQSPTTIDPRVGGGVPMTFVAVPIQIAGTTGQAVSQPDPYLQARLPVAKVTLQTHAPYVPKGVTTLPTTEDAWSTAFSTVLGELDDLHMLEQASDQSYYFGFMPKRTFGLAGLGYVPGNAAVGFDVPSSPVSVREVVTHEVGHNLSLSHAPCGGPADADPQYPYANAQLGAAPRFIWGYNVETKTFTDPRRTDIHDIMSYCDGDTFSDYNYRLMQTYLTPADKLVKPASAAVVSGPQELLLVSGQIESSGKVALTPLKSLFGEARLPQDGPYTLRIVTASGTTEYRFATKQIDHVATSQRFGFTIPHPGAIYSIAIVKDGAALLQSQAKPAGTAQAQSAAASAKPQVQATEQGGMLRLSWDHLKYPYLTVTHLGAQRTTLAQDLEGGTAALPVAALPAGGSFEFSLSDGMNSVRVNRNR